MSNDPEGIALSFWGAVGTVTGSRYLLETPQSRVLIDCGMFQGTREERRRNWDDPPFDPRGIDAVLLTHAHIDHIGALPRLVARGFAGPVYATRATIDLAAILLEDSARLMLEEADWRNEHGRTIHHPALPLFTEDDVRRALALLTEVGEGRVGITEDIVAQWLPVGHLLGARMIHVSVAGKTILFSGDVGRVGQPVLPDPVAPPACDYLVVESTYGDRQHPPGGPEGELADLLREAKRRDATVLFPAFAVGRTQDLLYHIRELEDAGKVPILPVRADSPMAARATRAYREGVEEHDAEAFDLRRRGRDLFRTRSMHFAESREDSRRLNDETGARVLIASSGMMNGGRVLHHARRILPDPNAILCFVGYQAEGTTGRRILDGEAEVRIFKDWVPVRCQVRKIEGFSGHADYAEILDWLAPLEGAGPKRVFITHGEPDAAFAMQGHLQKRFGWTVDVPAYGHRVSLA